MSRGPWAQTYSGRRFYALDPRVEDVCLDDVAHALSLQCRFGGHSRSHYSIAEHCVRASMCVDPTAAELDLVVTAGQATNAPDALLLYGLAALLHDAHEAYVVDVPRPLKLAMRGTGGPSAYDLIEERVQFAVCERFGVPLPLVLSPAIVRADETMLMTEARDLMSPPPEPWVFLAKGIEALPDKIEPWSPEYAKTRFLGRFRQLGGWQ